MGTIGVAYAAVSMNAAFGPGNERRRPVEPHEDRSLLEILSRINALKDISLNTYRDISKIQEHLERISREQDMFRELREESVLGWTLRRSTATNAEIAWKVAKGLFYFALAVLLVVVGFNEVRNNGVTLQALLNLLMKLL
jgi:hypothetical protein